MSDSVYIDGREGRVHIKSYVRRAGRMSGAQERYYADLMPTVGVAYTRQASAIFAVVSPMPKPISRIFGAFRP